MSDVKMKKQWVDVDTPVERVVELDKTGVLLQFEIDGGRFLKLNPDVVEGLSRENKQRYLAASEYAERVGGDAADDEIARLLEAVPAQASAAKRMAILKGDPDFEYGFRSVDELEAARAVGWEIVQGGVQTGQNPSGKGVTKFYSNGKVDMVMVRIPKKKHQEIMQKGHQGIEDFMSGTTNGFEEQADRSTGGSLQVERVDPRK